MLQHNWEIKRAINKYFFLIVLLQFSTKIVAQNYTKLDSVIGNKIILNEASTYDILKIKNQNFKRDSSNDLLFVKFKNTQKQYFKLYIYPGNGCCQYFEVGYTTKKSLKSTSLKFETETGIKLGLTLEQFTKIKDTSIMKVKRENGKVIFEYEKFSQEIERNEYTAKWIFRNNKLVRFGFGTTNYQPF